MFRESEDFESVGEDYNANYGAWIFHWGYDTLAEGLLIIIYEKSIHNRKLVLFLTIKL